MENEVVAKLVLLNLSTAGFYRSVGFQRIWREGHYMQRQVTRENMDSRVVDLAPAAKR